MTQELTTAPQTGAQLATLPSMAEVIGEWHKALDLLVRANELSATSATTYRAGMGKFAAWLATTGAIATPTAIREWKAALLARGAKPGSVNTWLAGVRAFYTWAVETGRMVHNPAADVKGATRRGTNKQHKRDALTDTEVSRLLDLQATRRDTAIMALFVYTAIRSTELHYADLSDLHTQGGALVLSIKGKGHTESDDFVVIAHPEVQAVLYAWLAERGSDQGPLFTSQSHRTGGERLSLRSIREIVKGAYRQAGITSERKTTHSLRHTAISNILRNGGTLQQAQAVARHANIATTGIYVHELDRMANAGERLIDYGRDKE